MLVRDDWYRGENSICWRVERRYPGGRGVEILEKEGRLCRGRLEGWREVDMVDCEASSDDGGSTEVEDRE